MESGTGRKAGGQNACQADVWQDRQPDSRIDSQVASRMDSRSASQADSRMDSRSEVRTISREEHHAGGLQGKWLLPLLAGICFAAVLIMVWALASDTVQDSPVFIPPPFEAATQPGEPEPSEELERLGYSQLDAQAYRAAVCGAPVVEDGSAVLYLTNPADNQVWLKVRILDGAGELLGESGLLRPGEYVKAVPLSSVPEAGAKVQLKLMAYEPETYHSAGAATLGTALAGSVD